MLTDGEMDILSEQNADAAAYEIDEEAIATMEQLDEAMEAEWYAEIDAATYLTTANRQQASYETEDDLPF